MSFLISPVRSYLRILGASLLMYLDFSGTLFSKDQGRTHEQSQALRRVYLEPDSLTRRAILAAAFSSCTDDLARTSWCLTLRFLPSFMPERQIVVRNTRRGEISVEYMRATTQLSEVLHRHFPDTLTPDIAQAADMMQVKRGFVSVPNAIVRGWVHRLWPSLIKSAKLLERELSSDVIQLDGTVYLLEYKACSRQLSMELLATELGMGDQEKFAIVRWMQEVYREIEKRE